MEVPLEQAQGIASFLADVQLQRLSGALTRVLSSSEAAVETMLISGSGSFLATRLVEKHPKLNSAAVHQLSSIFSAETAEAACAFAVAKLGVEQIYGKFC